MAKKFLQIDVAKLTDDKALAIAAYGESVAAYRYIILSEKARDRATRDAFEAMAVEERTHRERIQALLQRIAPAGGYYLTTEDKGSVCVGPRLVDARDDARFEEAMRLVVASEKRTSSFYRRYAAFAQDAETKALFTELADEGIHHVHRLRAIFRDAGKQIVEVCPVGQLR
jgi:rubrerythrin